MIIDTHQHFYRYDPTEYGWITDSMSAIRRDFLPSDLQPILEANGVGGTVAVQARQTVEETEWLLALTANYPWIRGVVGWAPLSRGAEVGWMLDRWLEKGPLCGIRHVLQDEPPAFFASSDFNTGLKEVARRKLVYDLLLTEDQLPEAITLVDRHPTLSFVIDHLAKPLIASKPTPAWVYHMREMSRRPNVACKLSGLATEVPDYAWTRTQLMPYLDTAIGLFGPQRLLFGTDWPVCTVACAYDAWKQVVESACAGLGEDERAAVMGGNAVRIYRMNTKEKEGATA